MSFHLLFVSSVSACLELDNTKPYYSETPYNVVVNGVTGERYETNVFSVFGLEPNNEYTIGTTLDDFTLIIRTHAERACLNVFDFGAKADGITDDTKPLQTAINACPPNGRVKLPAGTYLTGPLIFNSDMTMELDAGATLLASSVQEDYPIWPGEISCGGGKVLQTSSWEGEPSPCRQSFLSAHYKKNIVITGQGLLDGNAQNAGWWDKPKEKPIARPRMLFTNDCEDVYMHGMTVRNSPAWNLHPFFSKNIGFYDMRVEAPKDSPNTDGCDPESCDGVEIIGVRFSVGDDAIAIKSGKLYMGKTYKTPARRHSVRNCLMEFAHGGVVMGSEMSGGVRDLDVRQCLFRGTDRGLRIKTRRGRGKDGVIDGIEFSNIRMEKVLTPLVINMYYHCDKEGKSDYVQSQEPQPVDDGTPYIGRFTFRDIECLDCEYAAGYFHGLPECPIEGITIDRVSFHMKDDAGSGFPAMMSNIPEYSKHGLFFKNVREVRLAGISFEGVAGDEVVAFNVEKLSRE